jgi:hypothetical protein
MKIECTLELRYENEITAEAVSKAVGVDNYQFVASKLEGDKILSKIESNSISSLIHTLDDYLACVSVAEKVANEK